MDGSVNQGKIVDDSAKIRTLLVEDEPMLLQGLKKIIDWETLGFEICQTACNYAEAVAAASLHKPDVIISDIMLGENQKTGLDLVRELGNLMPEMQAILLTGYDVFEYAEKAIEYNVKAYLLKPVDESQLTECLLKLQKNFKDRRKEMQYRQELDRQLKTALPFLFEWFLNCANDADWSRFFGLTGKEKLWQIMVVSFSKNTEGQYLYNLFLKMEYLKEHFQSNIISFFQRDYVIYVLRSESAAASYDIDELAKTVQDFCDFNSFPSYVVGIGRAVCDFREIRASYHEAYSACKHTEFFDWGKCIYYSDLAVLNRMPISSFSSEKEKLQFAVRTGHVNTAGQIITEVLSHAAEQGASVEVLRSLGLEALVILSEVSRESGLAELAGTGWKKVELCESLADLRSMLISSYEEVSGRIDILRMNRNQAILTKVKQMVDSDYAKNITLENISRLVYLSPNYLSKLFLTEYKISFKDYLIQVRMEAAKKLLLNKKLKVYEVAESVGYSDSRYFSQVFKKYTDTTPLCYRSQFSGA